MRRYKKKVLIDKRVEDKINNIVNIQLTEFFKQRDKKLETNPAKLNLLIILFAIALFFVSLFLYGFYMFFVLNSLETPLSVFLLVQLLYLFMIIWSIQIFIRVIKKPLTFLGALLYSIMVLIGVLTGLIQIIF